MLYASGSIFLFLEFVVLACVLAWILAIGLELLNKKTILTRIGFLFPVVAIFIHAIAFIVWVVMSEMKFGSCDDISLDDREPVCGKDGPIVAIFLIIWFAFTGAIFFRIWKSKD
jgi:uncharacterized membrane protein